MKIKVIISIVLGIFILLPGSWFHDMLLLIFIVFIWRKQIKTKLNQWWKYGYTAMWGIMGCLILLCSCKTNIDNNAMQEEIISCKEKKDNINDKMQIIGEFFSDIYDSTHRIEKQKLMADILQLYRNNPLYFFQYSKPIERFTIKGILYNLEDSHHQSVIGNAIIFTIKDSVTHYLEHPMFEITDSIYQTLKEDKINVIYYQLNKDSYFKDNQLGRFHQVPFGFFDIDCDKEKELIIRLPYLGQRWRSVYMPFRTEEDSFEYIENYITAEIDSIRFNSEEYGPYPSLDDQTEFDYKNKMMILDVSGGIGNSEKEYYKIEKGIKPKFFKREKY